LEKDRELHQKEKEIQFVDQEMHQLKREVRELGDGNGEMMKVVQEYEKTISEIIGDRERERVCMEIEKEKVARDRDQTLDDLHSAERAFNDVHRKYERTKEIISSFKKNEDDLKALVTQLASRLKKSEERFEVLKSHAEEKLTEANQKVESLKKARENELAQLQAMLRKSEMRVNNLERIVEQKTHENSELTAICDELISKVGT
jgi:transforming acidic coiled-coil-containing protein 3